VIYSSAVKLFQFDGVDAAFDLLPLAARRALDLAGRKLSLEGYRSLTLSARQTLARLGSSTDVDVSDVIAIGEQATPPAEPTAALADPPAGAPDGAIMAAFGPERPIPAGSWGALHPLERYALRKVALSPNLERREQAYREIIGQSALSSHVAPEGGVRMVGVGSKAPSLRRADAESRVSMSAEAFARASQRDAPKGDVLGTARVAAVMAAKRTSELIPLCHPLSLTKIDVVLSLDSSAHAIDVAVSVECFDRTGVEMEALTAASVAALTIYDMLKGVDRSMEIGPTRLIRKSGGRTGDYLR
jgi:cyclic pyranopterin monophosphate synthase